MEKKILKLLENMSSLLFICKRKKYFVIGKFQSFQFICTFASNKSQINNFGNPGWGGVRMITKSKKKLH